MRHPASIATSLSLLAIAAVVACGRGEQPVPTGDASAAAVAPTLASGHEPAGGDSGAAAPADATGATGSAVDAAGLRFTLPASFEPQPPASSMRLAQAVVAGEAGPAELAVFHFGAGQGGSVEENFERWLSQVDRPADAGEPHRDRFETGGFHVQWIEAAGTLLPSGMGSGPTTPQPGSRLLAAVVEGDGGPWFFKLTGPDATVAAARQPFLQMLRGVQPAG